MRLGLVFKEAFDGLRRNFSMVISIVLVTFVSLTFVGAAVLMQLQIGQMKNFWYDKAQVAIYFCNGAVQSEHCDGEKGATQAEIDAVRAQLNSPTLSRYIKKYYFESQQQAYENFKQQFKGNAVADYVTPELLNKAYWVSLRDPNNSAVISEAIAQMPGVDAVTDQRALLDQIFAVLNTASLTAAGIAALMLIAAALLISTTIRLSAFSRRREIGIMRLVGASNRFIQTPFVLEGVMAALVGSVLAGLATVAVVQFFVQGYLAKAELGIAFVTVQDSLLVAAALVAIGAVIAGLCSNIAISRYLRV